MEWTLQGEMNTTKCWNDKYYRLWCSLRAANGKLQAVRATEAIDPCQHQLSLGESMVHRQHSGHVAGIQLIIRIASKCTVV